MASVLPLAAWTTMRLVLAVSDYVTVALGLVVSYIALRGYLDNDSRPMLFVAVGFALVLGVPGLLGGLYYLVPGLDQITVGVFTQASELAGMVAILYGLWMEP
jgi:heme A synthase